MSVRPIEAASDPAGSAGARCVLVTRPPEQARSWIQALRASGIDAQALPLIDTAAAGDPAAVDRAWADLSQWAALVFVSPNAVLHFFARRPAGARWPDGLIAAAPGPGTAAELRVCGVGTIVEPAAQSARFDSESLWQQLQLRDWRGRRVLIVRGESGRDWLAGQIRQAGGRVELLAAYRRTGPALDPEQRLRLLAALAEPWRHLWFFSSSESIRQLERLALPASLELGRSLKRSVAIATHPRIAQTARAAGFGHVLETRPELPQVVRCIQSAPAPEFSG